MKAAAQLSVRLRYPFWLRWYPTLQFWEPWHMAVLSHGGLGLGPPPVTVMAPLYHHSAKRDNPATKLLLDFEKRTLLGHLAPQVRLERTVPASLLEVCRDVVVEDLNAFWGDFTGHVRKHLVPDEIPHFDAAARAVRSAVRNLGFDPDTDLETFPLAVIDGDSYAALARAILFLAVLPQSPLGCRLYCARTEFVPYGALTLNIDVTERFLQAHGEPGDREVTLGLNLAVADQVVTPAGQVFVPALQQDVSFSTLFAPDRKSSAQMRGNGRSSTVILQ